MNFSEKTKEILTNFATINQSIVFNPGSQIKTISPTKTILAIANTDTEFENRFGIYDLGLFLSVVSGFENPEYMVFDKSMTISEGKQKAEITFAEPSLIAQPPEKDIAFPDPEVSFDLKLDDLKKVLKMANILGVPELAVTGDAENIYLEAINTKNDSDNNFKVVVGETSSRFRMIFKLEYIKILPRDYKVEITSKGISRFGSEDITYYIAVESHSKFEG